MKVAYVTALDPRDERCVRLSFKVEVQFKIVRIRLSFADILTSLIELRLPLSAAAAEMSSVFRIFPLVGEYSL